MIIATAGHIDHGKTTLVKALTGVDTDRLPEEKARGISIDLGFAYWPQADGTIIGFVDVPGHERFVRNMLAGVCAIDAALLIVAADDGVMPQTVEHLAILDLLGVAKGLAVVTKADRVPAERVTAVTAAVGDLLAPTALAGIPVLPASAISGDGVPALKQALQALAAGHSRAAVEGRHFRLAVDRVFSKAGSGTVVTGAVAAGSVNVGEHVTISPAGLDARVRSLQISGRSAERAIAGQRCALNLSGVEVGQLARGDWLVAPAGHAPTPRIDVQLHLLAHEGAPLKHWTPVHVHLGTADIPARVAMRAGRPLAPGGATPATLVLERPVSAVHGDRFILRDQSASRTLGGGAVIDPLPPAGRRPPQRRALEQAALSEPDPAAAFRSWLAAAADGVPLARFARALNLTDATLAGIVSASAAVTLGRDAPVALPAARVESVKEALFAALTRHHRAAPQAQGFELADLRREVAAGLGEEAFTTIARLLADARRIEISGSQARLPGHNATGNPQDEALWQKLEPALAAAGFNVPPVKELAPALGLKDVLAKDLLFRKMKTGVVIRVGAERFYPRATMAAAAARAQATSTAQPSGLFTAAQYRDTIGTGRTLAIEILEALDALAVTQRMGDARKMRKDYAAVLGPAADIKVVAAASGAPAKPAARAASKPAPRPTYRR
ncbi:MAG: selenocysteine-specific translation elongation factor [Burkholderiales bacterium]